MPDITAIETELDRYKCAEAEGRMLVTPCKVGSAVFVICKHQNQKQVKVGKVENISWRGETYPFGQRWWINVSAALFFEGDIGKTLFLSREEAEAALRKEQKNG
jgi:hypothetical protein